VLASFFEKMYFDSMKTILIACFLLFVISCKEKTSQTTTVSADSALIPVLSNNDGNTRPPDERTRLELPNYTIILKAKYESPHQMAEGYLFVYDKKKNKTDSLKMENVDDLYGLRMKDLTDSLKFPKLGVLLSWNGDSDILMQEFVGYDKDTLKSFFQLNNIISLKRKDQWTITGFVRDRDEIVAWSQDDYPVTISLKTGEANQTHPPVQYIGAESRALENVHVHLMKTPKDSSAYTIKAGTKFRVDTIYRSKNYVRLVTEDSLIIHAVPDSLQFKILTNTAG
jgi:hypothetical protein